MSVSKLPDDAEFRRGTLPGTAVNLAYIASKQIKPDDIVVKNVASSGTGNISSYVDGLYFAGYAGVLQGGAKITDRNLYVTDKFLNGDLSKPLYFIAKSRYYHQGYPIYASGDLCGFTNVSLLTPSGAPYTGNYIITVEPYEDYVSDGLPYPYTVTTPVEELDEIPYRIIVYVDTDAPLRLDYNKIDYDFSGEDFSYYETLNPYPYFEEDTLPNIAQAMTDENLFYIDDTGDEYQVSVPAKQINDTRKFEYFYWRIQGIVGSSLPREITTNPTPIEYPNLFDPTTQTWQTVTSSTQTTQGPSTGGSNEPFWNYSTNSVDVGIGIYDCGQGYDASHQPYLYELEVSQFNKLGIQFINPARSSHTTEDRASGSYWRVTPSDISTDEKLDKFNILIIPVVNGTFPFDSRLEQFSRKSFKGLIFVFDYLNTTNPPNLSDAWGVRWVDDDTVQFDTAFLNTDADLISGACSVHVINETPIAAIVRDPYDLTEEAEIFAEGPYLESYDASKFESSIYAYTDVSPAETVSISGVFDHRIAIMDPYSVVSLMGILKTEEITSGDDSYNQDYADDDHHTHNTRVKEDSRDTSHGKPEFYGHDESSTNDSYSARVTYNSMGLKYMYNAIVQLSRTAMGGGTSEAGGGNTGTTSTTTTTTVTTTTTETTDTNYVPPDWNLPPEVITIEYNTPWIRSWITTKGSLSDAELHDDDRLVYKDGKLMRKLLSGNAQQILQSYIASTYPIDFLALGDLGAVVEVDNERVSLVQEGDTYFAYTNTNGGVPFEAGISYPVDWIRSDHWTSRKQLAGGTLDTDLYVGTEIRKYEEYWDKVEKITKVKKIIQVPVVTPGAAGTYVTHNASWYITVQEQATGGTPQTVKYAAVGTEPTTTGGTEESKMTSSNTTFKVKSKEMETKKSTAYAWVYVPQCDKLLKQGSTGSDVSFWQTALKDLGYYGSSVDGNYGPITAAAVLSFQEDHDEILEDSIIGPETGGRIADVCAQSSSTYLSNHYTYVSTLNMLESRSGQYGRRTNPYGTVYQQPNLQDYVECHFSSGITVDRIVVQPAGGPTTKPWKVTRVTMHDSGGRVYDKSMTVSSSSKIELKLDKTYTGITYIYVHILSDQKWMSSTADAYYWGIKYIQAYSAGTPTTGTKPADYSNSISLLPGESRTITLPGDPYSWTNCTITSGQATIQVVGGTDNRQWKITDTRTGGGGTGSTLTGSTDSTTIKTPDGVKTFNPKLPSGATSNQTARLHTTADSSTIVEFYNGNFIGSSASVSSLQSGATKIGVKSTDGPSGGTDDTTTYVDKEVWEDVITYEQVQKFKEVIEQFASTSGHIVIEGQDPPVAFFAYKPYAVRQHDGRMNVRLFYPDSGLTHIDAWLPRISFGDFTRTVDLSGSQYGWQALYSNSDLVQAVYSVPELEWSNYGQFTTEYVDEALQFYGPRQVYTKRSPLLFNETLDGKTDISIEVNSTPLADTDIADISKTGMITLTDTISSTDEVIATYVVRETTRDILGLNLNPYPGHPITVDGVEYNTYQKIGLPIYVYLLPSYCRINGKVIADSVETDVIQYTTDDTIFDPSSVYYNKLAVLIGIVSCTSPVKPEDVIILDARSRGGGTDEVENTHLFDVDYFSDISYPENGFIIVDVSLNDRDKEEELKKAIESNIAAGHIYKIRWLGFVETPVYDPQAARAQILQPTVTTE